MRLKPKTMMREIEKGEKSKHRRKGPEMVSAVQYITFSWVRCDINLSIVLESRVVGCQDSPSLLPCHMARLISHPCAGVLGGKLCDI